MMSSSDVGSAFNLFDAHLKTESFSSVSFDIMGSTCFVFVVESPFSVSLLRVLGLLNVSPPNMSGPSVERWVVADDGKTASPSGSSDVSAMTLSAGRSSVSSCSSLSLCSSLACWATVGICGTAPARQQKHLVNVYHHIFGHRCSDVCVLSEVNSYYCAPPRSSYPGAPAASSSGSGSPSGSWLFSPGTQTLFPSPPPEPPALLYTTASPLGCSDAQFWPSL